MFDIVPCIWLVYGEAGGLVGGGCAAVAAVADVVDIVDVAAVCVYRHVGF